MKLDTFAERAWLAWHSLPRDPKGEPPGWKGLEAEYGVPGATFSKLFAGKRAEPRGTTVSAMARALRVDAAWLQFGTGAAPTPTGPVPPPPWQEVERVIVRDDRYPSRARAADQARRVLLRRQPEWLRNRPPRLLLGPRRRLRLPVAFRVGNGCLLTTVAARLL